MTEHQRNITKDRLLVALRNSLGIVTTACDEVGISNKTYYEWYKTDPDFKAKVDDINEVTLDFVENQLLKKIKEGSEKSIMFYMRYKARKRGYTDNVDITSNGNTIWVAKFPNNRKDDDEQDNE